MRPSGRHVFVIERRDLLLQSPWEFNTTADSERIAQAMVDDWNEWQAGSDAIRTTEYRVVKYVLDEAVGQ